MGDDATHQFTATATDGTGNTSPCSAPFTYIEDSGVPAAPSITDFDPNSPANENSPEVKGTRRPAPRCGCTSRRTARAPSRPRAPAAQFASPGLTASVTDDATHEFSATATDAVNNTSACSSAASYTEDSTAPAAPTLTDTDPDSPADDNTPLVKGTAEDGSTVNLYTNATCAAPASATGTAAALTAPGLEATVPGNSTTEFRATATDAAGNTSACSGPITYVEDSGPPGNAAPVCANGSANLTVGQSQNFTCTDADGDNLDYTIVAAPTRGTAAEAGSGATSRVTYTATSAGTDSFQVKANDGQSDSNTATITTTNTAPAAGQRRRRGAAIPATTARPRRARRRTAAAHRSSSFRATSSTRRTYRAVRRPAASRWARTAHSRSIRTSTAPASGPTVRSRPPSRVS